MWSKANQNTFCFPETTVTLVRGPWLVVFFQCYGESQEHAQGWARPCSRVKPKVTWDVVLMVLPL